VKLAARWALSVLACFLLVWLAGTSLASARESAECMGLAPSCHIGSEPACICRGASRTTCAWECVTRVKVASTH